MTGQLRCENGEWKTRDQFSNNQLLKYDQQVRKGRATAAKSGIRCLEHSSKQALELKCNGPCNRWRGLQFFSKSTRRNGKNWCVDCTDWQLKTENGEALPPPGSQFSVDEFAPRLPHPAHLRDDLVFEQDVTNFDDAESSFTTEDDSRASDSLSTLALSDERSTDRESVDENEPITYGNRLDSLIPPHLRPKPAARAPHWLIPDFGESPLTARSLTTSVDGTSVTGSVTTAPARGNRGQPVTFNAWGPNGEYARMTKTPTIASGTTRTTVRREPENQGRKGWAKVSSRKQQPQLPDYLKYDIPPADDDDDGLDLDSDDDVVYNVN